MKFQVQHELKLRCDLRIWQKSGDGFVHMKGGKRSQFHIKWNSIALNETLALLIVAKIHSTG